MSEDRDDQDQTMAGAILGFFLMGWQRGGKIQSGGAHGKSHVPQHKWDGRERSSAQVPGQLISLFIN